MRPERKPLPAAHISLVRFNEVAWMCVRIKRRPRADPVVCTWRGTASQVLSPVKRRGLEGRRENEPTLCFRLSSLQFCMLPDVIEMVFPTVTHSEGWLSFLSAICLRLGDGWWREVDRTRQRRRGRSCVEPNKEARAAVALIGCPKLQFKVTAPVCGTDSKPGSGLWENPWLTQRWPSCMWSFFKHLKPGSKYFSLNHKVFSPEW